MENLRLINYNIDADIKNAKAIINKEVSNNTVSFNDYSPIYKSTNECLSHLPYIEALKNKQRVLSIIGSGDQIINAILFGSRNIIGVDISVFPKYFLMLKLAAIKVLKKEDYLEYFYGVLDKPFLDKYYCDIHNELTYDVKLFWDTLYNDYNSELYNSCLFDGFNLNYKRAIIHNPFLQDSYYSVLKRNVENTNLEALQYNMFDAKYLDKGYFDLILLSNIIDGISYNINKYQDNLQFYNEYKNFLKTLPLNKKGIALTYNFIFNGSFKKYFTEKSYQIYPVYEKVLACSIENEILIYKKSKH